MAHRSAAQNGQYSAPMYSTSGLPPDVSGDPPLMATGRADTPLPAPTLSRVLAGTLVVSVTTLDSAAPVGPLLTPLAVVPDLEFSLTTTEARTTAMMTTVTPEIISTRLRTSARRAAAR